MKFKIGFCSEPKQPALAAPKTVPTRGTVPVKSLVQVYFPGRGTTLAYYNDAFDLRKGDTVFVTGKLEDLRGQVVDVSTNFKIKLSDYQRVIGRANADVYGTFHPAGSHLITFQADALPVDQVRTWFFPPKKEGDEYVVNQDGGAFSLSDPTGLKASSAVWERGRDYYTENRVCYLCVNDGVGFAIVEGTKPYEVEFQYDGDSGEISDFVCPCFCSYPCKHQVAVLFQLKEALDIIGERYADQYARSGYFAQVSKSVFLSFALDGRPDASITLA